jgi:cephalosporin hydroxylase
MAATSSLTRTARKRIARSVRARRFWLKTAAQPDVNPLEVYFRANEDRLIHKWVHYFDIYHQHLARYRNKPVTVLEFGVSHGGSLQMWKHYFGPQARIFGVDINERCKAYEEPNIEILIGDQGDRAFLQSVVDRVGNVDVVIDDGGHRPEQMVATFEMLWPQVVNGGTFVVEDTHAAYFPELGAGYRQAGTFNEYAKNLIDQMHAWHSKERDIFDVDEYTRTVRAMHVYDSMFVFEKGTVVKPHAEKTGRRSF